MLLSGIGFYMKGGVQISNVVKRSVSFSPTVNTWAEELAAARRQENNFSAFLADLVREAREKEMAMSESATKSNSNPEDLADSVAEHVAEASAKKTPPLKRRKKGGS